MKTRVYNVKRINLSKITDKHGNLSVIEENKEIPFEIKRTYWIYDVPLVNLEVDMYLRKMKNWSLHFQEVLI